MSHRSCTIFAALFLACCAFGNLQVHASDPELTTDFAVPPGVNVSTRDGSFFTSTALQSVPANFQNFATVTPVNVGVFPALQGLRVSSALLQFPPGSVNVPPLSKELWMSVFIDTTNTLFTQTLQAGDLYVFPKGLVHFQINYGKHHTVKAVAAFSSSNPGRVTLPNTLFMSNIYDDVLAKSFGVFPFIIDQLKAATVN